MRDSPFTIFENTLGPIQKCTLVQSNQISEYDALPSQLRMHWKMFGWGSYAEDFIWIVDPAQFAESLEDWLVFPDYTPDTPPIIFARTALADLFLWLDGNVYYINTYYNYLAKISPDIVTFFNETLCDKAFRQSVLREDSYLSALHRLGAPNANECYTYVPHPAIGGDGSSASLQRHKMFEYLCIVRSFCGPIHPYSA
jgi:hypothetical protein